MSQPVTPAGHSRSADIVAVLRGYETSLEGNSSLISAGNQQIVAFRRVSPDRPPQASRLPDLPVRADFDSTDCADYSDSEDGENSADWATLRRSGRDEGGRWLRGVR